MMDAITEQDLQQIIILDDMICDEQPKQTTNDDLVNFKKLFRERKNKDCMYKCIRVKYKQGVEDETNNK